MSPMTFASKLNILLKQKGWPQARINSAFETPVSPSTLPKWCEGVQPLPRLDQIQQIAKLFDVPVAYLADDDITSVDGVQSASTEEEEILKIVRKIGFDLSYKRLLQVDILSDAEIRSAEETSKHPRSLR